jgi:hypothetical protein
MTPSEKKRKVTTEQQALDVAQPFFAKHPETKALYITTDGNAFFDHAVASDHQVKLTNDREVWVINPTKKAKAPAAKPEGVKPGKAATAARSAPPEEPETGEGDTGTDTETGEGDTETGAETGKTESGKTETKAEKPAGKKK